MIKNIGPLERKILEILWDKKEASAREISYSLEESGDRREEFNALSSDSV